MTATEYATDWRSLAACLSADPDLFFPISASGPAANQIAQAKAICAGCQVRQACLDFALATHQIHGVWGGTSPEERQLMRHRKSALMARSRPSLPTRHREPATPRLSRR
ncbi:MAG TPA: WhiB family transcriptional regulator [Streptosporangiaceae bacterium]